jgi:amino-acid N-acetyltransferase
MLPVSLANLYERIRDFFVYVDEPTQEILGCGALNVTWANLGEIRSVAVREGRLKQGVGTAIVQACVEEARALGLEKLFVLTYEEDFFGRFGFERIDKNELPHKVWNVCVNCPHFPDCDEIAMLVTLV